MVVLAMITRNSAERIKDFPEVLNSTLSIPYKSMILIDDSDTSTTKNIVSNFAKRNNKELLTLSSGAVKTRAVARQKAIDAFLENYNDEWLFFLDDDIILDKEWWSKASEYLNDGYIGVVTGFVMHIEDFVRKYLEIRKIDQWTWFKINFEGRGYTGDTMFKRDALIKVKETYGSIPPYLHEYEDAWLFHKVRCLGYKYVIVPTNSYHLGHHRLSIISAIKNPIIVYKMGFNAEAFIPNVLSNYESISGAFMFPISYLNDAIKHIREFRRKYGEISSVTLMELRILGTYMIWLMMRILYGRPGDPCEK